VPLRTVVPKPPSKRPVKPLARVRALVPVTPIEAPRSNAALAAQQAATRTQSEHAVVGDAPPASATNAESDPTHSVSSGNAQARLISQALPTLPDDLPEEGYQAVAVARFLVHADGTFDIDLIKPTRNPRLNQILLETLRRWRFFPAMENGRPVESRQDVRVHFNVD
jgi:periplasmic protein TonB